MLIRLQTYASLSRGRLLVRGVACGSSIGRGQHPAVAVNKPASLLSTSFSTACPGMRPPLEGVKVLDLSRLLPGPYATQILADLGADVIKVESQGGDGTRYYPPLAKDKNSVMFHALNRGKRSIALDFREQSDVALLEQIIQKSDVLVESFRPGVLEDILGVQSSPELERKFPHLIICRISGYGQGGPSAQHPGHDLDYCAKAGVLGLMKDPAVLPIQVADLCGGSWPAVTQILAALLRNARQAELDSGYRRGCLIDVSLTDGAYATTVLPASRCTYTGEEVGGGKDMLAGGIPGYSVYKTSDGHIALGTLEPKFWIQFCKAMKLTDLKPDDGIAQGRKGEMIRDRLQSHLIKFSTQEILDTCHGLDVPVEKEASHDQQLMHRSMKVEIECEGENIAVIRTPIHMSGASPQQDPGPRLGEHTEQILEQFGLSR